MSPFLRRLSVLRVAAPLLLLLLWLLVALVGDCAADKQPGVDGETDVRPPPAAPRPRCWMFQHMVKSGGSTVRQMMTDWAKKRHVGHGGFSDKQWIQGADYAREFLKRKDRYLTWGEYTESLRQYGGGTNCTWFTMFRHPVPRLVSAYFYCQPGARGYIT